MKITVIGDGAWGTALAINLVANQQQVTVWGAFPDYLETLRTTRRNDRFLPGVELPEALNFESDLAAAVAGSDILLLATPTQFLRDVLSKLAPIPRDPAQIIVNVAKGLGLTLE